MFLIYQSIIIPQPLPRWTSPFFYLLLTLQYTGIQLPITEMRPRKFKSRSPTKPRTVGKAGHIIVGQSSTVPLRRRHLSQAMNHQAMPIVGPSGIQGTYTFTRGRSPTPIPVAERAAGSSRLDRSESPQLPIPQDSKRSRQYLTWTNIVLPELVPQYLHFLRISQSLARLPQPADALCTCGGKQVRSLNIICVRFDRSFLQFYWNISLSLTKFQAWTLFIWKSVRAELHHSSLCIADFFHVHLLVPH